MQQKIVEPSVEQQTFYETLFGLQSVGFWLPSTLKQTYQKVLYKLFTAFAYGSIILQTIFAFADLAEGDHFQKMLEMWFLLAIFLFTVTKCFNILAKRDMFFNYLSKIVLSQRWTKFRDADEKSIIEQSKKNEVFIFKVWGGALFVNALFLIFNPIITENPEKKLLWESYSPCDRQVPKCFWIWYIHQAYSYAITTVLNLAYDCLNYAVMERSCAHVKILQHRLKLLPELVKTGALSTVEAELDYLKQCITDHQDISIMANKLHDIFNITIIVQFLLSFTVMCTNVFTLTRLVLFSSAFCSVLIYFCCILMQNLFYSWYGYKFQEITEEISYVVFGLDWTVLNKNTIKLLRFTMLFATKPIPLYNNFVVDLSPEMFLKVLKLSYSTYNVLKASNE